MVSNKAQQIPPFIVMDVLEKAQELERSGEHIIHLEVGEPDFDTPECISEAGYRAICDGKTHYTHSLGLIELREAIAEDYWKKYRVRVSPEQILVASGTSPAMLLLFSALLEPGDEIILSNPYYPCYPNIIRFVDGSPAFVEVLESEGFQYLPKMIEEKLGPRVKGIMINSPSNPTGNVMPAERMKQIAKLSPFIISDEIYHGLVYEGEVHTILEFTDHAFVINGFSKLYAMTGWRLGYVIAPKEFIRPMQKIQQNLFISASSFAQWGAVAGLKETEKDVVKMRETYDRRRRFLIPKLKALGFGITVEPTGAFYILANAKKFSGDSYRFAFDILKEAKVAVAPGIDFGTNAEGYLRFCYANSMENIEEGMNRLERYLKRYPPFIPPKLRGE
ncbi:MAG TPA: pyridoxal phosphate-dependent aminotransferase [Thermodesulfobacteriota bacterium]|nr:pyridoxal phosphate-dependent aminotransferase [Thermodesulfobacteriota bacterium]